MESSHDSDSIQYQTLLRGFCEDLGFDLFGVARAHSLTDELAHLEHWLSEGMHGEMNWLERDPERRCDPKIVLPGCQSVIVVARNYLLSESEPKELPNSGKVSRYAQGKDYHRVLDKKLKKIARRCNALGEKKNEG